MKSLTLIALVFACVCVFAQGNDVNDQLDYVFLLIIFLVQSLRLLRTIMPL